MVDSLVFWDQRRIISSGILVSSEMELTFSSTRRRKDECRNTASSISRTSTSSASTSRRMDSSAPASVENCAVCAVCRRARAIAMRAFAVLA